MDTLGQDVIPFGDIMKVWALSQVCQCIIPLSWSVFCFLHDPGTKSHIRTSWLGPPRGLRGKEFAASEGEAGSIPGSGRPPGGGHGQHPSILAWRVPCTEEPGGLQSMRSNRGRHNRAAGTVAPSYYGFPVTRFLILTLLFLISKGHSSFIPPP